MFQPFGSMACATMLAGLFFASTATAQQPNRPPAVVSPQVEDSTVTFRVYAPQAEKVELTGSDFPNAGPGSAATMTKADNGVWSGELELPPGSYRYNFSIDDVRTMDPQNVLTSQSNAVAWSLVNVPGSESFDTKDVPHGAVAEVYYQSAPLERVRRMHIYTPPGYEKGQDSYPVFYLLHGASDGDDSWSTVGRANMILDNLIADGKAKPMIVVMPNGHTGSFTWGGGGKPFDEQMKEFEDDFNQAIRPYVEANYRTKDGRANRAIAGLSMGGAQTLNLAIPNLKDFAYVGVFSSGVFGISGGPGRPANNQFEESNAEVLDSAELKEGLKLIWFGCGEDDFLLETSRATVGMLKKHGFDVVEHETDGGHTWKNWRDYLNLYSQKLFQE